MPRMRITGISQGAFLRPTKPKGCLPLPSPSTFLPPRSTQNCCRNQRGLRHRPLNPYTASKHHWHESGVLSQLNRNEKHGSALSASPTSAERRDRKEDCHHRHSKSAELSPSIKKPSSGAIEVMTHQHHLVEHSSCTTARVSIVGIGQAAFLRSTHTRNIGQHQQHQLDGISSSGKVGQKGSCHHGHHKPADFTPSTVQGKEYQRHQSHQHHPN